jgi:hypothetical protein
MGNSMSRGAKILLAVALTFVVLMVGSGMLLAATVVRAGALRVKVHEPGSRGTHVDLTIPAAVVYLGLDVLPLVLEDEIEAEIRTDLREYGPAMAAALRELENAPDAVLVDVRDAAERVRVSKKGRTLEVRVDGPDGRYEITLPASLLGRIAREIA